MLQTACHVSDGNDLETLKEMLTVEPSANTNFTPLDLTGVQGHEEGKEGIVSQGSDFMKEQAGNIPSEDDDGTNVQYVIRSKEATEPVPHSDLISHDTPGMFNDVSTQQEAENQLTEEINSDPETHTENETNCRRLPIMIPAYVSPEEIEEHIRRLEAEEVVDHTEIACLKVDAILNEIWHGH